MYFILSNEELFKEIIKTKCRLNYTSQEIQLTQRKLEYFISAATFVEEEYFHRILCLSNGKVIIKAIYNCGKRYFSMENDYEELERIIDSIVIK
jgi:hypothetical protein